MLSGVRPAIAFPYPVFWEFWFKRLFLSFKLLEAKPFPPPPQVSRLLKPGRGRSSNILKGLAKPEKGREKARRKRKAQAKGASERRKRINKTKK